MTNSHGPAGLLPADHLLTFGTFSRSRFLCLDDTHNLIPKLTKQRPLSGLGHKIGDHVLRGAPLHGHLVLLDTVSDKEETNVDVFSSLGAGSLAILLQKNGTLIVLVDNIFSRGLHSPELS